MADRYWVGGTAAWDSTAGSKWALTSGGAGGQAVPTTADTVFFDAASGANTVTIGAGVATCSTLTMTGFTGTIAFGTNSITCAGTGTVYTGDTTFSVTGTPLILCSNSSSTSRTISPGATTEANSISFNITAGTGTFNITASNAVRNLDFTGFTGALALATRTIYGNLTLVSGMTLGSGASAQTFAATSGIQTITSAGLTQNYPIAFAGTATYRLVDALTMGATRTMTLTSGTLDLNNNTLTTNAVASSNSNTRSILFGTGNITLVGTSATLWNFSTITGFTYTGTPTVNLTNSGSGTKTINCGAGIASQAVSFYVQAGTGTINFNTTNSVYKTIDLTGFSGTFVNSTIFVTGNFIVPSGVTVTSANTVNFINPSTQQITTNGVLIDLPINVGRTSTTTAATGNGTTATISFASVTIFPSVGESINIRGVTPSGYNGTYTVTASTSTSVSYTNATTGAQTVAGVVEMTGNVQLVDDLTLGSTRRLTLTTGTFNSNAKSVTVGDFNSAFSNNKTFTITNSTFTVAGGTTTTGFIFTTAGTTFNVTGSNIVFTTSGNAVYYGGTTVAVTYPQVTMSGTGILNIGFGQTTSSITTLTNTVQPCTISVSTTSQLTVANFNLSGTAGNLVTFNSNVPGTARTISKSSGTVNAYYLNIQDSTASGGATFNAVYSTDSGNNVGWTFSEIIQRYRLTSTGTFYTNTVELDEVTKSAISMAQTDFFAAELDEVTTIPVAMRQLDTETVIVQTEFDEVTVVT